MKKQKKTSLFIDVEAEESDDWSSDFSEELTDMNDVIDKNYEDDYKDDYIDHYKTKYEEPTHDWAKFTEHLEQKYKDQSDDYDSEESVEVEEEQSQQALVPTISSPKLWLCRVKPGKEKIIIAQLYEKMFRKSEVVDDHNKKEIKIFSAIFKESLPGYIYIEAYNRQSVIDAFENIRNVNKTRISAVPINEMTEVLQVKKSYLENVHVGSYARIKRGKYKDDLCQITGIDNTELVNVKIIPRLGGKQELFNPKEHKGVLNLSRTVDQNLRGGYIFNKQNYTKDGFLITKVPVMNLRFDRIEPTFEELELFSVKTDNISVGDKVRTISGDMKNIEGVVESIDYEGVRIKTDHGIFTINKDDVVKNYNEGDEVSYAEENVISRNINDKSINKKDKLKIASGSVYKNGIVLKIDKNNAILAIDDFSREVEVPIDKLNPPVIEKKDLKTEKIRINRKKDILIYKKCKICQGNLKGISGVIKDVYKDELKIQLDTNSKLVTLKRDFIEIDGFEEIKPGVVFDDLQEVKNIPTYVNPGIKSPSYKTGFKTPSYKSGFKTPNYGSGFKTPSYGSSFKTPNYNSGFKTPRYNSDYKTPRYRDSEYNTPGYRDSEYKTPGYRDSEYNTPGYRDSEYKTPGYNADYNSGYKTPKYNDLGYKTPNYKNPGYKTPKYNNQGYKTPTYKNDNSRTPAYHKYNTPGYTDDYYNNQYKTPAYYNSINLQEFEKEKFKGAQVSIAGSTDTILTTENDIFLLANNGKCQRMDFNFIVPDKFDRVCVLEGDKKGIIGKLINIDGDWCTVETDNNDEVNVKLGEITKMKN
ncbi:putative transcription elongation factor SPT5 like protein 2 [Dictyocoela muelleri]|nr:putative transcription elongation factor SPT5 like protein 2 [Dictyocoela muelleri]